MTQSPHTAPPTPPPQSSPHTIVGGMLNQLVQERDRVQLEGVRSGQNVTACTHEYTLPAHMQMWGLSHFLDCCHRTACSDTQCNICTHRLQLHVCVGCKVRLTVNKQTNKQTTTSHSPVAALLTPSKSDKGSAAEVHRECTRDASTEWTTHVALTWCVAGHCQRA